MAQGRIGASYFSNTAGAPYRPAPSSPAPYNPGNGAGYGGGYGPGPGGTSSGPAAYGAGTTAGSGRMGAANPSRVVQFVSLGVIAVLMAGAAGLGFVYSSQHASLQTTRAKLHAAQATLASVQAQVDKTTAIAQADKKVATVFQAYSAGVTAVQTGLFNTILSNTPAEAKTALHKQLDSLNGVKTTLAAVTLPAALQPSLVAIQQGVTDLIDATQAELNGINTNNDNSTGTGIINEQSAVERLGTAMDHLGALVGSN